MTAHRDLKNLIRSRQAKTGESYTAARTHVMRERAARLGLPEEASLPSEIPAAPVRLEAVVLRLNQQSARVRILGEQDQVTFRSGDLELVVPGHVVTLVFERRWTWRGDSYGSGRIENPRIDVLSLGLVPLPLRGGELVDLRRIYEHYRRPDPYAPRWRKLTATPRASYEMDGVAWGAFPAAPNDSPVGDAADLAEAGDEDGARERLMEALLRDLRCIDAHAHLGNRTFAHQPEVALAHYEVGIRIGELSLPSGFDGVLVWGELYNRPFLRCLRGYGLCLWRMGRLAEAQRVFERVLSLNPNDNQGVRFCWQDVLRGRSWEEMAAQEEAEMEAPLH